VAAGNLIKQQGKRTMSNSIDQLAPAAIDYELAMLKTQNTGYEAEAQ
jgi:hypothetical protein